jgi:hypothetical protein
MKPWAWPLLKLSCYITYYPECAEDLYKECNAFHLFFPEQSTISLFARGARKKESYGVGTPLNVQKDGDVVFLSAM